MLSINAGVQNSLSYKFVKHEMSCGEDISEAVVDLASLKADLERLGLKKLSQEELKHIEKIFRNEGTNRMLYSDILECLEENDFTPKDKPLHPTFGNSKQQRKLRKLRATPAEINEKKQLVAMRVSEETNVRLNANLEKESLLNEGESLIVKMIDFLDIYNCDRSTLIDFFQYLDTNGTGEIDKNNIREGLCSLGMQLSNAQLKNMFKEFDRDNTGGIDFHDFRNGIRRAKIKMEKIDKNPRLQNNPKMDILFSVTEKLKKVRDAKRARLIDVFKHFDKKDRGQITKKDLGTGLYEMGITISRNELDSLFQAFDLDNSGTIEYSEFHQGIQYADLNRQKHKQIRAKLMNEMIMKTGKEHNHEALQPIAKQLDAVKDKVCIEGVPIQRNMPKSNTFSMRNRSNPLKISSERFQSEQFDPRKTVKKEENYRTHQKPQPEQKRGNAEQLSRKRAPKKSIAFSTGIGGKTDRRQKKVETRVNEPDKEPEAADPAAPIPFKLMEINFRNVTFRCKPEIFAKYKNSVLGRVSLNNYPNIDSSRTNIYYFDHDPDLFQPILNFYRTGNIVEMVEDVEQNVRALADELCIKEEMFGPEKDIAIDNIQKEKVKDSQKRFQKRISREISENGQSTEIFTRKNERLLLDSVKGQGKVMVNIYDEDGTPKAISGVVFDSAAFFHCYQNSDEEVKTNVNDKTRNNFSFPGGYKYEFFALPTSAIIPQKQDYSSEFYPPQNNAPPVVRVTFRLISEFAPSESI